MADTVEAWLARAPAGPIPLGSEVAKAAIKALVDGWEATMLRALAARPLSLTEFDSLIAGLSYPALEEAGGDAAAVPRHVICGGR